MTVHVSVDPSTDQTTIVFTIGDDHPGEVSVVGSFNGWTAGVDTLVPQDGGTRSVTVAVPAGQDVHFRYLGSDGHWFDDPDAEITPGGSVVHLADSTTDHGTTDHGTVEHTRADLIPEEQVAGSDDPQAQAEAIITDSETRVAEQAADVEGASTQTARRTSAQATDPL